MFFMIVSCSSNDNSPALNRRFIGEVTDLSQYSDILSESGEHEQLNHFPSQVPPEAIFAKFHFHPRVFQGSTVLQLRLGLSSDAINDLWEKYSELAKYSCSADDVNDNVIFEGEVPTTSFLTSDSESYDFPSTYEILIIDAVPLGKANFEWNHGISYGVAIDVENLEILYWYEDW